MTALVLKNIIADNIAATVATIGLMIYFLCTALVFVLKPEKYGRQYSVQPVDNAGKTEIRVYYGGISFALALFLGVSARTPNSLCPPKARSSLCFGSASSSRWSSKRRPSERR